jgi:hypothetical protein
MVITHELCSASSQSWFITETWISLWRLIRRRRRREKPDRLTERHQVAEEDGSRSSGRWSPAGSPHGRRQQKLGEATNSSCSTLPHHQSAPPRASAGRRAPLQPVASVVLVRQDEGLQARARPWRPAGADPLARSSRWPGRGELGRRPCRRLIGWISPEEK